MKNAFLFSLLMAGSAASAQDAWRKIGEIAPEADGCLYTSIAIDSSNVLYVAYSDLSMMGPSAFNGTTVKKFEGTSWLNVGPRTYTGSIIVGGTKIAVDQQGTPYVIYSINPLSSTSAYFSTFRLDKFDGTSWNNVRQFTGSMHVYNALAITKNNDAVFTLTPNSAANFNTTVTTTAPISAFNMGLEAFDPDFAIASNNDIYMAYRGSNYQACVQRFNGTNWEFIGPSTGFSPGRCNGPRIALDQNDVPYVVYLDQVRQTIEVKRFNGTDWELVGASGFPGSVDYPDIAIDRNNVVYVSYNDFLNYQNRHPNYLGLCVQKFNGTSWEFVGQRTFSTVNCISVGTQLIVGKNNVLYIGTEVRTANGWKSEAYYYGPPAYPEILPVRLQSFTVQTKQNGVIANWTTSSESNNKYFILERSKDSKTFSEVSRTNGAGNSNTRLHYSYTDTEPYSGRSYYRLKQVDHDGNQAYSEIRSVVIRGNQQVQIASSNNGGSYIVNIEKPTSTMRIEVYEMKGRLLYKTSAVSKSNTISLNNFAKGIYLIKVMDGSETMTVQKVMR